MRQETPKHIQEYDDWARSMGLHTTDELAGPTATKRLADDLNSVDAKLPLLPPLDPDREPLPDWFMDTEEYRALHGGRSPDAPSISELQRRRDEYQSLVYRAHNQQNRLEEERDTIEPGTPADHDGLADQLWAQFRSRHPDLAGDEGTVSRAAARVAKRQGIGDPIAFVDRVAAEVRAADAGRGHVVTGGGARAPEAEPEPRSMFEELTARQRAEGLI
jgi:hypothetical protein